MTTDTSQALACVILLVVWLAAFLLLARTR